MVSRFWKLELIPLLVNGKLGCLRSNVHVNAIVGLTVSWICF
jgi:hypothetical protein